MAMPEQQEHRSPPLETATAASVEPQLPSRSGPITGGSASAATSMATAGDMAGGGGAGEEQAPEEASPDNIRPSWASLFTVFSLTSLFTVSSHIANPSFPRKPRSHVHRAAAPSNKWAAINIPAPPPARKKKQATKKQDTTCALCGATKTPRWRTWPTDRRVSLCNACGIQVRAPGVVLPELVYLPPVVSGSPRTVVLPKQVRVNLPPPNPATATTTTTVPEPEVEQPPRPQEIQDSESPPDSPILESMLDVDIYLRKRTTPRQQTEEPTAAAPAPGKQAGRRCRHCGIKRTLQWRTGPEGEGTLCNACGVIYRKGRLVPEYRPKASPTFDESAQSNSNIHREVLEIRRMQDDPTPPAPYLPVKPRMKRRKQQQPAQVGKKQKKGNNSNKEKNQQPAAQAQPAAAVAAHQRKHRRPPQPAAAQPHVVLPPSPPPELPQAAAAADDMEQHLQDLPPAQPHAGDDLVMSPPDSFLFDGPSAPMIIEDNDPMVLIVIDDD